MSTPLVRIKLGADWENHSADKVVQVDAIRGAWIIKNIPGSVPNSASSAANLGIAWPIEEQIAEPSVRVEEHESETEGDQDVTDSRPAQTRRREREVD